MFARGGEAHESRPAYLEIKETAAGRYSVLWRTPVLSGMRLPVALKLPESMRTVGEPVTQRLSDSLIERRVIETDAGGLAGQRIDFVGLQATITDVLVRTQWRDGTHTATIVRPAQAWLELPARQSRWAVAGEYAKLGIEHILFGIDHLLFVLALLLITKGITRLIKTVTAFTVAHSITLGLATLGFVHVPIAPVEAVIALSIVFVAAEIIHARRGLVGLTVRAPWVVAFIFGLLHGFGFAGALSEVGLPPAHIPVALLFFNIGVELGQLLFIATVLGVIAVVRRIRLPLPRWAELVPPYAIGGVAMYWVIQRAAAL
ncbi:MAG: HupE/UreJ family protein [Chthoniobacteraceae bacterium]